MNRPVEATIRSAIREGESHIHHLRRASTLLEPLMPLTAERMTSLTDDETEHIDQFIYRFIKMQDSLGRRLIPSLYAFLESDEAPTPFLDILARLEQLEIIPSVRDWQYFRELRNNLAHDYPEELDQTSTTINTLHRSWRRITLLFENARDAFFERLPPESAG